MTAFVHRFNALRFAAFLLPSFLMAAGCWGAPAQSYSIAGTVVNAQTGDPVPRANVAVLSVEDSHMVMSVVCDSNGRFALAGLAAARYQLTASRRGFQTGFYDQHGDFNSAIVTAEGQDTTHLVFRLMPDSVLYGTVSDDAGGPVEHASVLLFLKPRSAAERITQASSALTDDTGAYEFGDLPAGTYLLAVQAGPWYALHPPPGRDVPVNTALDVAYPITYYDSTTDESSATPIDLAAGSRTEANVTLHAVPALHLVVNAPRNQAGSIARPELRQFVFGTQVAAESAGLLDAMQTGTTEFDGIAPGRYELRQGDPPRLAELDATSSGPVDPNLGAPLVDVNGVLTVAGASARAGSISVLLSRVDPGAAQQQVTTEVRNGSFHLQVSAESHWQVSALTDGPPPASLTVLSVHAGGAVSPGNRFAVSAQPLSLSVSVSQGAARVEGVARKDGKPMAGAMIVLIPRDLPASGAQGFAGLVRRDQSDSDGSFSLRDAVPGSYSVVAIEDGWNLDWTSPAVLSRYLGAGVAVTVPPDSAHSVSLSASVPVQTP